MAKKAKKKKSAKKKAAKKPAKKMGFMARMKSMMGM